MTAESPLMPGHVVGVRAELKISKRDLLLFDEVILLLGSAKLAAAATQGDDYLAANGEYLLIQQFFIDLRFEGLTSGATKLLNPNDEFVSLIESRVKDAEVRSDHLRIAEYDMNFAICRDVAATYNREGLLAFALPGPIPQLRTLQGQRVRDALGPMPGLTASRPLLEVVISALPIPEDDVPLDYVLDFARDPTTVAHKRRLVRAVSRASMEGKTAEVFRLNLEEAVSNYRDHMRLADVRHHSATVTALLSLSGAMEELLHLRPRKAIDSLLEFRKVKADRLEAELTSPGREVAFIYEADKRFGPSA